MHADTGINCSMDMKKLQHNILKIASHISNRSKTQEYRKGNRT